MKGVFAALNQETILLVQLSISIAALLFEATKLQVPFVSNRQTTQTCLSSVLYFCAVASDSHLGLVYLDLHSVMPNAYTSRHTCLIPSKGTGRSLISTPSFLSSEVIN
jgi:hypothetical protein